MKTVTYTPKNPEIYFTVTKKDINNSKALLPKVLYNKMELFLASIINNNAYMTDVTPKLYQLELLKNAFLNDILLFQSGIKKFSQDELQLCVVVKRKEEKQNTTICRAIFKFQLNNTISKAS